jgi:hypothetical protein
VSVSRISHAYPVELVPWGSLRRSDYTATLVKH